MNNDRILINKLKSFENINSNLLNIILVLFGTLLLAISSKVQVPFWPVPMTMQTFVIFLIGMTYGVRLSFCNSYFISFRRCSRFTSFCFRWRTFLFIRSNSWLSLWYVICFSSNKLFCKFRV